MPPTAQPGALRATCVDQEAACEGSKGHVEKPLPPTWYRNEKLQGLGVTCAHPGSPRRLRPTPCVLGLPLLLLSSRIYLRRPWPLPLFPPTSGRGGGVGDGSPRF